MKKLSLAPFLALACIALLSSCAEAPAPVKADRGPVTRINLDVRTISLTDRSSMPAVDSPYNTSHFQPTIAESIRQWASSHLQATGASGEAIIIIKDASLTAQPIPYSHDWFTRQQASKYTGHAEVEIDIKGPNGDYAMGTAEATHFETLPEDPTDLEKQNAYTVVLNGLMRDLGQNIDASLHEHMQGYMGNGMSGSMGNDGMGGMPRR